MAKALNKVLDMLEKELVKNRLINKLNFNLGLIPKVVMFLFVEMATSFCLCIVFIYIANLWVSKITDFIFLCIYRNC